MFPLPKDSQPEEIVAGLDGRMYFTLAGKPRLGSVWSLPGPGEGEAGPASQSSAAAAASSPGASGPAPWALPIYQPRPERPKGPSHAERRQAYELGLERAQARFEASLGSQAEEAPYEPLAAAHGPVASGEAERKEEASAQASVTPTAQAPAQAPAQALALPTATSRQTSALAIATSRQAPALAIAPATPQALAQDPLERLEDLGVNLSPGAIRHILAGHGAHAPQHKSRFHPAFQTQAGLTELLATGLAQAGVIARTRVVDAEGRYLTLCRARPAVGWYHRHGHAVPTHSFLVVTSRWQAEDGQLEHDLLTAYPVSDHW